MSMAQGVASAPALRHEISAQGRPSDQGFSRRREPHRHTYGAIDLGTNNCRLLIARPNDGGFTVIDAFSRIVRLGEGLSRIGRTVRRGDGPRGRRAWRLRRQAPAPQRLAVALGRDRGLPPRQEWPRVRRAGSRPKPASFSTSSSPREEARLAVLGCHKLLEPGDGPALIFDIGGGSTELVLIDQEEGTPRIRAWWSAPWGVVSLTESEGKEALEGPGPAQGLQAHARARAPRLSPISRPCCPKKREGIRLLGTSGTVTTLASVHLALPSYDRRAVDGLHVPDRGDAEDQRDDRGHGL